MLKHLLLADDSITIRKAVELAFAGEGFEITSFDNGEELLEHARQRAPDGVLADVAMPRMNGYEVCEALKGDPALRGVPVLLLTGSFEAFDPDRARAAQADAHLAKPFESKALVSRVKALLEPEGPRPEAAPTRVPVQQRRAAVPAPVQQRPAAVPAPVPAPARPPPPREVWSTLPLPPPTPAPIPSRPRAPVSFPVPPAPAEAPAKMPGAPAEPLTPMPASLELDWSDLDEPSQPQRSPQAAAPEAAAPPRVEGAVPATLDSIDFGEPSAFAEPPRAPLELEEEAPLADDDDLEIIDLPIIDLTDLEEEPEEPAAPERPPFAVKDAPAPRELRASGATSAPIAARPPASPPAAPAADGGEAQLREALSRASREVIERIAWEVVPQLAEVILREHVERLVKARDR